MKLAPKKYNREEQLKKCNKDLRKRINRAIKYIENNNLWTSKEASGYSYMKNECNELLEILKGSDKE